MAKTNLKAMGREWAMMAIRHNVEPTTTGNLEHDQACAEFYLRQKGAPPAWYSEDRFGPIYHEGHPPPPEVDSEV